MITPWFCDFANYPCGELHCRRNGVPNRKNKFFKAANITSGRPISIHDLRGQTSIRPLVVIPAAKNFLTFSKAAIDFPDCEDSRACSFAFRVSHPQLHFGNPGTDIQEQDKNKATNNKTKHGMEKSKPKSTK
ncbi:hypothetical protein Tco_1102315 [Tanacetum coccineum]